MYNQEYFNFKNRIEMLELELKILKKLVSQLTENQEMLSMRDE